MSFTPVTKITGTTEATPLQPEPARTNQKTSLLAMGLSICKYNPNCTEKLSCYSHIGVGNLIATGNKVSILTVAHLFSEVPEEYFLVKGDKPMFPFRYAIKEEQRQIDGAIIPVGEMDPEGKKLTLKIESTFQGTAHFHLR